MTYIILSIALYLLACKTFKQETNRVQQPVAPRIYEFEKPASKSTPPHHS